MAMNLTNGDESSQPLPEMSKDISVRRPTLLKLQSVLEEETIEGPFGRPKVNGATIERPLTPDKVQSLLMTYVISIETSLKQRYAPPSPINSLDVRESSFYLL